MAQSINDPMAQSVHLTTDNITYAPGRAPSTLGVLAKNPLGALI